jgi:sugar/nucleoside kinase (ribokinase family)
LSKLLPARAGSEEKVAGNSTPVIILGDVMTDIVVQFQESLHPGSDTAAGTRVLAGGSGANQAAWLAWRGWPDVHFIGSVGDDVFGRAHLRALQKAGVTPHLATDRRHDTGMIIVLVDTAGERTMITDRGANRALTRRDLPADMFRPGAWFHLSGYLLFDADTREIALAGLDMARTAGMRISVDPSSTEPLADTGPSRFLEWTRGADLCFPNLAEGRLLTGEDDERAVAGALAEWYGGVALKLGSRGALWAAAGHPILYQPGEATSVTDTTGAGDAFCAGFLSSWLGGAGAQDALAAAVRLGTTAVSLVGGRPPGEYSWLD